MQARRQDLAAGGPKTRRVGTIFKIHYWMYAATGGSNVKWGAPISNGGQAPLAPPAGDGPGVMPPPFSYCGPGTRYIRYFHTKLFYYFHMSIVNHFRNKISSAQRNIQI